VDERRVQDGRLLDRDDIGYMAVQLLEERPYLTARQIGA
jgi:hypothetical protein